MGFILIKFLRRLGIEVFSAARVQEAIEPVVLVFFVAHDLAVRLMAPAMGLVVSAPRVISIPLASLAATLVAAFIPPITFLLAFVLVGFPRLLEVTRDVTPTLHLIGDLFDIQGVLSIERVDILVVGKPVLHRPWENIPEGVFEVIVR